MAILKAGSRTRISGTLRRQRGEETQESLQAAPRRQEEVREVINNSDDSNPHISITGSYPDFAITTPQASNHHQTIAKTTIGIDTILPRPYTNPKTGLQGEQPRFQARFRNNENKFRGP
jgi:hypothetical protein